MIGCTDPFQKQLATTVNPSTCLQLAAHSLCSRSGGFENPNSIVPSLHCVSGERVPLYIVGQYEPKELWSEWWIEIQRGLLRTVGLFKAADKTALSVVKQVQQAFAKRGMPLSLV